jgi:hypothetical protein
MAPSKTTSGQSLDGHTLFIGLFHTYAATYKEMRDSLEPSSREPGQESVSQEEEEQQKKKP